MMKLRMPQYFEQFHCVGGDCPDTCCRDWEVVLEPETAERYRAVPGALGADIRSALTEADGEPCLLLRGGFCPMLDARGLCRIQLELGEAYLSGSCRQHPRFAEEYGALREWSLSLACPEAVRLMLAEEEPMAFSEALTDEPVVSYHDLDPGLYLRLSAARNTAFALAQDRTAPWQTRLARLLSFGALLQKQLDQHRLCRLETVTARFAEGRYPATPAVGGNPEDAAALTACLRELEPINRAWPELLEETLGMRLTAEDRRRFAEETAQISYEYEHLMVYYLYRYFLKAVTDRRLLPRLQLMAVGVLAVRQMEAARWLRSGLSLDGRIELIHCFSREVEHSETNLRLLDGMFAAEARLTPAFLTGAAW